MTEDPLRPPPNHAKRAEKLQAIAAVFGESVAARLAGLDAAAAQQRVASKPVDADRVAWQTNRLIHHLRQRTADAALQPTATAPTSPAKTAAARTRSTGPKPLPALMAGEDLAAEHPAVIAHMLRDAPQAMRVTVLRALPGHVARMVMGRLRTG